MRGSPRIVNKALLRPLLYFGVEKSLIIANAIVCFPLVASTHLQMPACFVGLFLFVMNHALLAMLSKHDPIFAKVFKRYTRYLWQPYFPARSHPEQTQVWPISTVELPR